MDGGAVPGGKYLKFQREIVSWTSGIMIYARNEVRCVKHSVL